MDMLQKHVRRGFFGGMFVVRELAERVIVRLTRTPTGTPNSSNTRVVRNALIALPQTPPAPAVELSEALIAARAYERWQQRGCPMGQDGLSDWYAARAELERELRTGA